MSGVFKIKLFIHDNNFIKLIQRCYNMGNYTDWWLLFLLLQLLHHPSPLLKYVSVYHPGRIRRDHGARELENKQTWLLDLVETNPWLQFTRKCGVWPVLTNNIITDHSSDTGLGPGWRDVCFPETPIITNYHQSKKRWINHYFNESFSGVMFLVFTPMWWWCYGHTNVGQMNHIKIEIH